MYPWDVLGIDQTDDKRVIKKAYAQLLRKYRPDEQPEQFQEVNQAYQFALKIISSVASDPQQPVVSQTYPNQNQPSGDSTTPAIEPDLNPSDTPSTNSTHDSEASMEEIEDVVMINPNPEVDELRPLDIQSAAAEEVKLTFAENEANQQAEVMAQRIDAMLKQTHEMAFSSLRQRTDLNNWQFLEFFNDIHDIDLRDQLAKEMFRRVAEYNIFQKQQNHINLIPNEVMIYMNDLFHWEANWQEYAEIFPESYMKSNFADMSSSTGVSSRLRPTLFSRSMAFVVDLVAYYFILGLLAAAIDLGSLKQVWLFFVGFMLFRLSFEMLLKNRATLGTNYTGYRFLDHYLNLPSRKTVLKRFLCFEFVLLPVYMVFFGLFSGETAMIGLSSYVVVVIIFAYVTKGQLPQDYLSQTVAVRK